MSHEHIEHAEHAMHAAHDPFGRNVALTIAVVAAVLAAVTVLTHRSHTETLRLQGEAVRLQAESSIKFTEAADKWSLYQAQNIRKHEYEAFLKLVDILPAREGAEAKRAAAIGYWEGQVKKYEKQLKEWREEAQNLEKESKRKSEASLERIAESHDEHERATRYDVGELFVEVAVVLCSVAILTRRKSFWFTGMACCLLGAAIALTGYLDLLMPAHHAGEGHGASHGTEHSTSH